MPPSVPPFQRLVALLQRRPVIGAVLAVNAVGILYGFYYYLPQFRVTPVWLWPLVPDSPMAVLLASTAVVAFAARRDTPLWNAIAMGAMVKVGLWTAVVLPWFPEHFQFQFVPSGFDCSGTGLDFRCADLNTYLFYAHVGMAAEALVLAGRYPLTVKAYAWTAAAFVAIDAVDYFLPVDHTGRGCDGVYPYTVPCDHHVATFAVTALLSVLSLALLWVLQRLWQKGRAA